MSKNRRIFLALFLALAGVCANGLIASFNRGSWDADFNQYYAAGKLAGSGHLYDWDAIRQQERPHGGTLIPFYRLPVFAAAFKPLTVLPYRSARLVWFGLSLAAWAAFPFLWPVKSRLWAWAVMAWSVPAAMCLAFGQDSMFFLFFVALGLKLLLRNHDFVAGLVFSLCASKPHLALALPVLLVARRNWRAMAGGMAGGTFLLLASVAVEGPQWPLRFLALTQLPIFDPASERMPNLRGLLSAIHLGLGAEVALALVALGTTYYLCRRVPLATGAALAVAVGLWVGHHSYSYDCLLLLPVLLLPFEEPLPAPLREWAALLLTPVPYLLLLTDSPGWGALVVAGYTPALLCGLAYRYARRPPVRHAAGGGRRAL